MNTRMIPRSLFTLSSRLFAHPRLLLGRTTQNLVPFVVSKRNFSTNNANDKEENFGEIKKLSPYNFEGKHRALDEKYKGISESPFSDETMEILLQPVNSNDIEVRADGMIYLPEIKYRRILLQAFGPGGWALRQTSDYAVIDGNLCVSFALYCHGRYVAEAVGEQQLTSAMTFPTSIESAKSNALVRCCKDLGIASELWDPHFINEWKSHNRITETVNGRILYKKKPLSQIDSKPQPQIHSNPQPQSTPHPDLKTPFKPTIKAVNLNSNINPNANASPNANANLSTNTKTNPNPNSTPNTNTSTSTSTSSNANANANASPSPRPNSNPELSPSPSPSPNPSQNASVNPKPNTTTNTNTNANSTTNANANANSTTNANANANQPNEVISKSPQSAQSAQSDQSDQNGAYRLLHLFKPPGQSETPTQQTPQSQQTETQPKPMLTSHSQRSQAPPSPKLSYLFLPPGQSETQPNTTTQNPTEQTTEKPIKIENNPPKPTATPSQPPKKTIPPFLNKKSTIEPTTSHKATTSQKPSEKPISEKPEPNPLNDDGDDVFQSPFRAAPTPSSTNTQKTEPFDFELMLDQKVPPEYKKVAHLTWKHVFNEPPHVRYLIWAASSMKSEHLKSLAKQALEFIKKNPTRFPTALLAQ